MIIVGADILVDADVLNQLIDTTLLKDRDFITWRAEQPSQPATAAAERQAVIGSATSADKHV